MAVRFKYDNLYQSSCYPPNGFDTVRVTGLPNTTMLDEIRLFFLMRDGPCSCSYIPGYPASIAIRFTSTVVAQHVVYKYNNAIINGFRVQVSLLSKHDASRTNSWLPSITPGSMGYTNTSQPPATTHNLHSTFNGSMQNMTVVSSLPQLPYFSNIRYPVNNTAIKQTFGSDHLYAPSYIQKAHVQQTNRIPKPVSEYNSVYYQKKSRFHWHATDLNGKSLPEESANNNKRDWDMCLELTNCETEKQPCSNDGSTDDDYFSIKVDQSDGGSAENSPLKTELFESAFGHFTDLSSSGKEWPLGTQSLAESKENFAVKHCEDPEKDSPKGSRDVPFSSTESRDVSDSKDNGGRAATGKDSSEKELGIKELRNILKKADEFDVAASTEVHGSPNIPDNSPRITQEAKDDPREENAREKAAQAVGMGKKKKAKRRSQLRHLGKNARKKLKRREALKAGNDDAKPIKKFRKSAGQGCSKNVNASFSGGKKQRKKKQVAAKTVHDTFNTGPLVKTKKMRLTRQDCSSAVPESSNVAPLLETMRTRETGLHSLKAVDNSSVAATLAETKEVRKTGQGSLNAVHNSSVTAPVDTKRMKKTEQDSLNAVHDHSIATPFVEAKKIEKAGQDSPNAVHDSFNTAMSLETEKIKNTGLDSSNGVDGSSKTGEDSSKVVGACITTLTKAVKKNKMAKRKYSASRNADSTWSLAKAKKLKKALQNTSRPDDGLWNATLAQVKKVENISPDSPVDDRSIVKSTVQENEKVEKTTQDPVKVTDNWSDVKSLAQRDKKVKKTRENLSKGRAVNNRSDVKPAGQVHVNEKANQTRQGPSKAVHDSSNVTLHQAEKVKKVKRDSVDVEGSSSMTLASAEKQKKEKLMEILEMRKQEFEQEYEREVSTLLGVVKTLARKDPSLNEKLKEVVRISLMELGDHLAKQFEELMEGVALG